MRRNYVFAGLGFLLLLLGLGAGLWWWRQPRTAAPTVTQAPAEAAAPDTAQPPAPLFTSSRHDNGFGELVPIIATEDKAGLQQLYQRDYIREFYATGEADNGYAAAEAKHQAPLPPFDLSQPLAGKSYLQLLWLRNTLYARNGYCFMNATARQYFDKQPWYRPVWDEGEYRDGRQVREPQPVPVPLNKAEMAFAQRVHAEEVKRLAGRVRPQGGYPMLALDFVVNPEDAALAPALRAALTNYNFALVPTREEQLFYLYDQNEYAYTPNFVTTDLILQLLHKHLNGILSDVEEERLRPALERTLIQSADAAQQLANRSQQPAARLAASWAAAYYLIANNLLTRNRDLPPAPFGELAARETALAIGASEKGSAFLQDSLFQYSMLRPRGVYTRNDTTRRYFRAFKYLSTAPVFLDTDAGLLRAVALAQAVAARPAARQGLSQLARVLDLLVGPEDNRSLRNLLALLDKQHAGRTLDQLAADPAALARLRQQLVATGRNRIRPRGASGKADTALARPTLLLAAGRYTFDAEILGRLVHVRRPQPLRPFPKGLDAFAAFGVRPAQDVLLNHYQEARAWPAYPDSLRVLQRRFAGYQGWNQNLYNKTMQALLSLNAPNPDLRPPYFARTPAWQRRTLSTALAGWTQLKHDLLLYTEQPMAAEMGGGGGGPPAPDHLGYVEPNLPFWQAALDLLAYQDKSLKQLKVNTPHLDSLSADLRRLVGKLHGLAKKEVTHQPLTTAEMNDLAHIGGEVERLTLRILKTDQLPVRERRVALTADVYSFNEDVLQEAVGDADALYVVVEINGLPVLARGAAFSYYEFTSKTRLTDEQWQAELTRRTPARPTWLKDLVVPVPALNKNSNADHAGPLGIGFGPVQ